MSRLPNCWKQMARNLIRSLPAQVDPLAVIEVIAAEYFNWDGYHSDITIYKGLESEGNRCVIDSIDIPAGSGPEILGLIYETLLEGEDRGSKQGHRRRSGIFYTPAFISDFLIKSALDQSRSADANSLPMIIDPACGSGAFLLSAYKELKRRYPKAEPAEIVTRSIHGVDSDERAVHVARISLCIAAGMDRSGYKKLCKNLHVANSLVDLLNPGQKYDVVVGNPPYRNVKRGIDSQTKDFIIDNFVTAKGQLDLSVPFIELALRHLLKNCGAMGYIIPNPIFLAENYEPIRALLLENDVVSFGPAGRVFHDPNVEASLLVARRGAGTGGNRIAILGIGDGKVRETGKIRRSLIEKLPSRIFSHLADEKFIGKILDRLESGELEPLGDHVSLTRGIECGKRDARIVIGSKKTVGTIPLITGDTLSPYSAEAARSISLPGGPRERALLLKHESIWLEPVKLFIRRVADRPIAAVYKGTCAALNTLYVAHHGDFDPYSLCALINSSIFREIFTQMFAFDDKIFPYLRISQLKRVPIPVEALTDKDLSRWSREMHKFKGEDNSLRSKIDRKVKILYELGSI